MRRTMFYLLALTSFAGAGGLIYHWMIQPVTGTEPNIWVFPGVPVGLLVVVGIVFLIIATSSNIYRVKHGKVIGKHYTKAHWQPMPPISMSDGNGGTILLPQAPLWVEATYELRLQRPTDGRTGWVGVTPSFYVKTAEGAQVDFR